MKQSILNFPEDLDQTGEMMTSSSPEDSHANPTLWQESDWAKKTRDISSRRCLESFKKFSRNGSWAKMFSALLIGQEGWYSKRCKLTWKLKGTKSNRMYFQLQVSALAPIEGTEFGLLRTPTCEGDAGKRGLGNMTCEEAREKNRTITFSRQIQDWSKGMMPGLLPTPTAIQREHPERVQALQETGATSMFSRANGEARPNSILDHLHFHGMLPTPTTTDYKGGATAESYEARGRNQSNDLRTWAAFQERTGKTSQLNPLFVMEMMGFPPDWTLLPFLSGETNQSKAVETP